MTQEESLRAIYNSLVKYFWDTPFYQIPKAFWVHESGSGCRLITFEEFKRKH